jgi:prepilin-type N-terminal cleavage/methylation domain-containing protein
MRLNLDDRRDAGFTLVELLISIVILGVIMVPLGNAVIGIIRNTDATSDRLALSHDAQISAAYFDRDVAAVGLRDQTTGGTTPLPSIQLGATYDAGGKTCGTPATPAALVRLLSDDWDGTAIPPVVRTDIVAYYLAPSGAVSELHRIACTGSATPGSDIVLAHNVDPATPGVTCAVVPGGAVVACAAAPVPPWVTLAFSVTKTSVGAYPITLTGQRRQT